MRIAELLMFYGDSIGRLGIGGSDVSVASHEPHLGRVSRVALERKIRVACVAHFQAAPQLRVKNHTSKPKGLLSGLGQCPLTGALLFYRRRDRNSVPNSVPRQV